jgi:hypothetical protein
MSAPLCPNPFLKNIIAEDHLQFTSKRSRTSCSLNLALQSKPNKGLALEIDRRIMEQNLGFSRWRRIQYRLQQRTTQMLFRARLLFIKSCSFSVKIDDIIAGTFST